MPNLLVNVLSTSQKRNDWEHRNQPPFARNRRRLHLHRLRNEQNEAGHPKQRTSNSELETRAIRLPLVLTCSSIILFIANALYPGDPCLGFPIPEWFIAGAVVRARQIGCIFLALTVA
jgi:hypothetical protein